MSTVILTSNAMLREIPANLGKDRFILDVLSILVTVYWCTSVFATLQTLYHIAALGIQEAHASETSRLWLRGYSEALAEAGLSLDPGLIISHYKKLLQECGFPQLHIHDLGIHLLPCLLVWVSRRKSF